MRSPCFTIPLLLASAALISTVRRIEAQLLPTLDTRSDGHFNCHLSLSDASGQSNKYDLTLLPSPIQIVSETATPPSTTLTEIALSLCHPLPDHLSDRRRRSSAENHCGPDTRVCTKVSNVLDGNLRVTNILSSAGSVGRAAEVEWSAQLGHELSIGSGKDVERSVMLSLAGQMYAGVKQHTHIEFFCDPDAEPESKPTLKSLDVQAGNLSLAWHTPFACAHRPLPDPLPTPPDEDKGPQAPSDRDPASDEETKAGWGWLTWIVVLALLGAVGWLAVGTWHNYNQYGVVRLPGAATDLAREAPYLVKEFARHVAATLSNLGLGNRNSGRGGYEPV
ncbi:Mannose-6-phosphate receptor binding domain [Ceraceosorus bombacis]|uniref:Autophagy-related protein 27 n=1 Tax=Ceraceosorus bombacis TaxID=401625 RepID=A0A0P1BJ38_9BASI|nr:Mannose-6-phosphate receptor binding domain [Ceraceosorus bombacis]